MKNKTFWLAVLAVLGLSFVIFTSRQSGTKKGVAVGQPAPDFEVADLGGGHTLSSATLRGRVVFLNFWASWCQPCKDEMPSVQAIYKETLSNDNFVMITVLYKDSPENAAEYMKEQGYNFPVYLDPNGRSFKNFGVTGVPETYVIDKKGILRRREIGPADWTAPGEKGLLASLLNG